MSLSVTDDRKKSSQNTLLAYLAISAFCGIFSAVYERFSHGVYSPFMVCLALIPLAGGALPFLAIRFIRQLPSPSRASRNLYNSGIATLTVGSVFRGVIDIYGTTSVFSSVYFIIGAALLLSGVTTYLIQAFKNKI